MTSYAAADAGLPCRNPSCSSRGKPHPNCRCYPNLYAEGGEVKNRCEGSHKPGCEHYMTQPANDADDVAAAYAHHGAAGALKPKSIDDHIGAVRKGNAKITASMKALFEDPKSLKRAVPDVKARERLAKHLESGGIAQSLKDGDAPELEDSSIAKAYPAQNVLLNASRAAREGYLNSLRPQDISIKLPFDDEPDQSEHRRMYEQALDLANDPLSVIPEIGHGTLETSHVKHLGAMAPELSDLLKRKMTEKVMQAQLKDQKPPYHVRQAMSLFMGTDLSSELTPQSIAAAQATFATKPAPDQPPTGKGKPHKASKGASTLSKADQAFLTDSQARQAREQKT